ncbi:hypothetical protein PVAND_007248 [Polypedilum vanderplanki]|uniref:Uncharacterized protein n=1 Tax=Polypedilum vanderplanki TaxID=319348 RepID=A0A9J6C6P2_POLVA|nr:hypothetical protein PVAND_007248 [Polypedilum vanderplanki]
MFKEIFIALCFVVIIAAFPSEDKPKLQLPVEATNIKDKMQQNDLERAESRFGFGRGFGHYGSFGGWKGFGIGHGFGSFRGFGHHGYRYWG